MNKTWTIQAEEFIANNCAQFKDKEIIVYLAERFDIVISISALRKKRVRLGLKKKSGRGITQLMSALGLKGCNLVIKGGR